VDAQALGEVLGEMLGLDTSTMGMATVGRRHRHHGHHGGRSMQVIQKPAWREHQLAPGVQSPSEGMEPLPITPDNGTGIFISTSSLVTWRARPQRPFRGERLLAQVLRSGTSTAGVSANTTGVFVGTALQQLQIGSYNLEFFTQQAFGVRLNMIPAEPGIDISIGVVVNPTGVISGSDFINVELLLLGECLR
jgi:hypothetical protein